MILVTGATGHIGAPLVRLLADAGHPVRVLTRDLSKVEHLPAHVERAHGDLGLPATLTAAFSGVDRVFLLDNAYGHDHTVNALAAAKIAGVGHIVNLSSVGVLIEPMPILGVTHHEREELIRASGIPATFLRPASFATNTLAWRPMIAAGVVRHPIGDARYTLIAPEDIAAVAAEALTGHGHEGQAYWLTGGEALTVAEQVGVIAKALGRDIAVEEINLDEAEAAMVARGIPERLAAALRERDALTREGRAAGVSGAVRELLGREPEAFADWCARNATEFTG